MAAHRKLDAEALTWLQGRLQARHHLIVVIRRIGLTHKALAQELGVHVETVRRLDYQLHGHADRDPHFGTVERQALNYPHMELITAD